LQYAWVPIIASLGPIKDGKLLALAVSTASRNGTLPDVPTIAEAGFPGGQFDFWVGMLAPGKTPKEVLAKINAEVNREFDAFMRKEHDVLGQLMRDAGATPQ